MRKIFGKAILFNYKIIDLMRSTIFHPKSLQDGPGLETV